MSEISKCIKTSKDIEVLIQSTGNIDSLRKLQSEIEVLSQKHQNFQKKIEMIDPITGHKIYGETMVKKILELQSNIEHLTSEVLARISDKLEEAESAEHLNCGIQESENDIQNDISVLLQSGAQTYDELITENEIDLAALNAKAEVIREQKHQRQLDEQRRNAEVI